MAPKFEIVQDEEGKFRFHFKDDEGQVRLRSLPFKSKINAQTAVAKMRDLLLREEHVVRHSRPGGEFFFTVKNQNGEVVARSEFADSESRLESLVASVRESAKGAALIDLTSKASKRLAHR
ncbi:MAG: hypothetical protein Fur0037_06150 [Planctomycetota bacterium]